MSKLHRADTFSHLFESISMYDCGFDVNTDIYSAANEMKKYYPEEKEHQFGVVGIELSQLYFKTEYLPEDYPVLKYFPSEKWKRMYNYDLNARDYFTITTNKHIVRLSGGSVKFYNKENDSLIKTIKGYKYLYTGDINPDETELMALENGKHFYIFSLIDFSEKKRITLPSGYESIDVCGKYSADGNTLYIPIEKYINEKVGYGHWLCQYETENYELLKVEPIMKE